ncbi:MAG: Crp/Fnr family transcriptional regulator [Pikeienuella sp.]
MNMSVTELKAEGAPAGEVELQNLLRQQLVQDDNVIAEELRSAGKVINYAKGDVLMERGEWSDHVVFILSGEVGVVIGGNVIATLVADQHVGEMAVVDPNKSRSATVEAVTDAKCLIVEGEDFCRIADNYPMMWRRISSEMAERLRRRG